MKILHIITSLRTGGAKRLVVDLAKRHIAEGNDVSLLLFDGTRTPLLEELEKTGIPVHALSEGWRAMRNPALVFKLSRFLRKNRFDIIHTHNTSCQFLVAVVSLWMPLTMVTTEHNTTNRRRGNRYLIGVDRWMYGRYRRIACVSEETRLALVKWIPMIAARTVVIPNGISLDRFRDAAPAPEISETPGYRILMVAAFRAQKDQATLIRAFRLLSPEYHLFLAGGAETKQDEDNLQSCKALAEDSALAGRVHFLGIRSDVPALLAACDVSVLSSHYEGFGLSAVESMACGKPLIASNVKSLDTVVGGAGLLFPEGDAEKLADTIRGVCENPALAQEVAEKCRRRALRYDIAETARQYRSLYEEILK